jgi:hypothetical protein
MRVAHSLSSVERGTGQDNERKPASKGHSHSVKHRGWISQDGKESQPVRVTHRLLSTEQGTSQERERKEASYGHSPTVESRVRDWSGQQKKSQLARATHILSSAE